MDLQVYPFPQWLTVLIAKLPVNSTVLVLWCFFCGAPFAVFHCLKWEGGVGGKGEIWSNICFFELAFQIPRLHFLRSRATGCKIFWAFMKKKRKFSFSWHWEDARQSLNVVRRCQNWEDDSGVVRCLVLWGVLHLCVAVWPSREWAKSKAFNCIRRTGSVFSFAFSGTAAYYQLSG